MKFNCRYTLGDKQKQSKNPMYNAFKWCCKLIKRNFPNKSELITEIEVNLSYDEDLHKFYDRLKCKLKK